MQIAIIGSGIGALGASIRLRAQGHDVTVFEANSTAGGKLHHFALGAYRFDGGPSLFTMPQYVTELFKLAGKDPAQLFQYHTSPEACRYFWEDGKTLTAHADLDKFATEVERVFRYPARDLHQYFDHIENIHNTSASIFLERSLHKAKTWLDKSTLQALLQIRKYDLFKSMHRANVIRLGEPHLVQLFDRFATYNGSNPYKAPGILNVIPWLEHGFGTYFPVGGMIEIPRSLHKLAEEMGVKFHFNQRVNEIATKGKKVTGVRVNEKFFPADLVVSNMDVYYTYRQLLAAHPAPEKILSQERSSSALVFYWGVRKSFPALGLHNIFFSKTYEAEFKAIFNDKQVIDDPTVYIHVSSKLEKHDAPEGCENWFVMVNTPHHTGQSWEKTANEVKTNVLSKLSRLLQTDIASLIEEEKIWTPRHIEAETLSYQGALYGNSSNSQFAAFLRHPNFSKKIEGLYFCGGSVHPGGGIPLALLSGKITAELIAQKA